MKKIQYYFGAKLIMKKYLISGYLSAILATLFGAFVGIEYFFGFSIPTEAIVAYWSIVFGLFSYATTGYLENTLNGVSNIRKHPLPGVEIYEHSEEFIESLIRITQTAEVVCTINFSPARGKSPALDRYFKNISKLINDQNSSLRSFMSIANIENTEKAKWILDRALESRNSSRVSLGCFRDASSVRLMCFHVVLTKSDGYAFIYPPVPLTGVMQAVLIKQKDVANMLKKEFDIIWEQCIHVNHGHVLYKSGLEFLAAYDEGLKDTAEYKKAYANAS